MNKSESKYFNTAIRFDKALLALLEKKPFDYITISEVCKEAQVNRSTFYLHYENMSDLLRETTAYMIGQFSSYFSMDAQSIMDKFVNCDLQELNFINSEYLHPYLSFIKENQRIFSAVLSCPQNFETEAIFQRMFEHIFQPILSRFGYPAQEQQYVMLFYLNGIMAVIRQWLLGGCEKSMEDVCTIICHCIFGKDNDLIRAIGR